jgi:hypothetical protein
MPRPKTDDYDDEERDEDRPRRQPRPNSAGSATKPLLILGAVCGGVVLLCCGVGLFVLLRFGQFHYGPGPGPWGPELQRQAEERRRQQDAAASSDQHHAKAFLEYWLAELRLERLDEAYRLTTTAYQARTSRQEFERFLRQNSDLQTPDPIFSHGIDGKPGDRFTFLLHRPKTNPYGLTVAREGGEWKLDDIAVK